MSNPGMDEEMSNFSHGDKLDGKIKKEKDSTNKRLVAEIKPIYDKWKANNLAITGTTRKDISHKVKLLNEYKNFINQSKYRREKGNRHGFSPQSKFHSSVLEEFMYYLLKGIPKLVGKDLRLGHTKAYSNLYFAPPNIDDFETSPKFVIDIKDQDFSIYKKVVIKSRVSNCNDWKEKRTQVPIVSIECKTYLDKTMYSGSVATADRIKQGNPYCVFLIVAETYEIKTDVDPRCSRIDQIYVLRKNNARHSPIREDLVWDLFEFIKQHISSDWYNVEARLKTGKMI